MVIAPLPLIMNDMKKVVLFFLWGFFVVSSAQAAAAVAASDTMRVTFVGDLLLDRGVRERIESQGVDALFSPSVDSLLASSHCVVANLECPATKVVRPVQKWIVFRGEPEWLAPLRQHGITHLNLANNHSIDQRREGLMSTINNILDAGMTPLGAGANMREAAKPVLLTETPRQVWLLPSQRLSLENFPYLPERPCVSQEDFSLLLQRVSSLKRNNPQSLVIVTLHWGGENTMRPILQQVAEAHQLVDAGADIIIGHHSHTMQPVEHYRGKPIYYSIGNFIFDAQRPFHDKACAVTIDITADDVSVSTIPLSITNCVPSIDE